MLLTDRELEGAVLEGACRTSATCYSGIPSSSFDTERRLVVPACISFCWQNIGRRRLDTSAATCCNDALLAVGILLFLDAVGL